MATAYLVRYGLARAVARFAADPDDGPPGFERGDLVVVRTHRGVELGEVLAPSPAAFADDRPPAPILRPAGPDDRARAGAAALERDARFDACLAIFAQGEWPLEPIDAEPLLDRGRTVIHYLGPHRLDASGLVAALRDRCGLDVVLEPAGPDLGDAAGPPEVAPDPCGAGGCSGCSAGGGCSGCPVKTLAGRRKETVGG